jgi:hypothetical protein
MRTLRDIMNTAHVRVGGETHKTLSKMSRIYGLPMSTIIRIAVDGLASKAASAHPVAAIRLTKRSK